MKFFRAPCIGTIRRRFVWWPRHVLIYRQTYKILPGPKVPYELGWHHANSAFNVVPGYSTAKPKHAPGALGYVTPVMQVYVNVVDHWVWLESMLFERNTKNHDTRQRTWWAPFDLPEQWDLWYEYE